MVWRVRTQEGWDFRHNRTHTPPSSSSSSPSRSNWGVWEKTSLARQSSWTDRCVMLILSWLWEHIAYQLTLIVIFHKLSQRTFMVPVIWDMLKHAETCWNYLLMSFDSIFLNCELQNAWDLAGHMVCCRSHSRETSVDLAVSSPCPPLRWGP